MKNRVLLVFLAMVLVVSLAAFVACKAEEVPPVEEEAPPVEEEEAPPVEEAWEWPDKLMIVSTSTASAGYGVGVGWTTPLAKETGMKIRMVTEDSYTLRMKWISQGLFFATGESATDSLLEAKADDANRDGGPFQVRAIWPIAKADNGFAVRGDSGIKTPNDIKPGMKIIHLSYSPFGRMIMEYLLAWANVSPDDVEWVPANTIEATVRFIMDGKGDVSWGFPVTPAWYEAEAAPHGLAWIEMDPVADPEGAARYLALSPGTSFGEMTTGVPSAHGVKAMSAISPYTTRAETDPDLVYHVVKWLDENYDLYKDAHPWAAHMSIDNMMRYAATSYQPIHEGTVRYLKEKGLWTAANEKRNQQNIDLLTKWVEAYHTAIELADEQGIDVDPKNEVWIDFWVDYKTKLGLPEFAAFTGLD